MSDVSTARGYDPSKIMLGAILAWVAVLIFASSNSVVSTLAEIGQNNKIDGRNAITFCNLLLVGSMMSMLPMVATFWRDWSPAKLRAITRPQWVLLTASAFLSSALTPGAFFYALEQTSVTNVVLVGRIEPPLFLLATVVFLSERFDRWSFAAGLVALAGAVLMILMRDGMAGFIFGKGEIAALVATLSYIASTILARAGLQGIPLGIFAIYRTALGMVFYFVLTMILYGPEHYRDVFAPVVWQWVWIYAVLVVIGGQFVWAIGLKYARSGDVSLATSFSPLAAILIAMVMLGENPGPGLIPGGALILVAIAIGQYGRLLNKRKEAQESTGCSPDEALEEEGRVNFKGA